MIRVQSLKTPEWLTEPVRSLNHCIATHVTGEEWRHRRGHTCYIAIEHSLTLVVHPSTCVTATVGRTDTLWTCTLQSGHLLYWYTYSHVTHVTTSLRLLPGVGVYDLIHWYCKPLQMSHDLTGEDVHATKRSYAPPLPSLHQPSRYTWQIPWSGNCTPGLYIGRTTDNIKLQRGRKKCHA